MKTLERIPEETIEQIRTSNDIVDVVSEYVSLKKQGRNYFGLCPFHGEKSPSFSVSPDKQIYHCFGCGSGGNVYSFLMNIEGYTFIEAVSQLAQKTGIELPNAASRTERNGQKDEKKEMAGIHELLSKLYHHLLTKTAHGKQALEYLVKRGFTEDVITRFQIGYAPPAWDTAVSFLQKREQSLLLAEQAGLLAKRQFDGKHFDRFRDRIMFPIHDRNGTVIAFGGRVLGDDEPKYLNSPETKIFQKGKNLYNLHAARPEIRKTQHAVVFEGYVDTIAAYRAGVLNGVATLGTSLTEEQAAVLKRNAQTVTICYDSDRAGVEAAFRASQILEKADCAVKIAQMPDGMDPDDYIQKYGSDKFVTDIIGASMTVMGFKIRYYRRGKNLRDEGERMLYIEEIIKEISALPKAVERDHYLRQIASEFNLSLDALKQQQGQMQRQFKKQQDSSPKNRDNKFKVQTLMQKPLLPKHHNAERMLLAYMLKSAEYAQRIQEELEEGFNLEEHQALAAYLYAFYEEGHAPDIGLFVQRVHDEKLRKIVTELAMLTISDEMSDQAFYDYIKRVSSYPLHVKVQEMESRRKEAERQQDWAGAARIAVEILELKKLL
ncbi:DNA primase [Fictibacillus aquaticus]|uniref:DNA primase n=1 Tax=Fictibacillus aquaticus TaxID=2021314 RepID=UPI0026841662